MRLDAYIRVSKVGGRAGESFISPDVQREQIAAAASLMGARVIREHVDLDQSGGDRARPGWQAALARVEAGETDGIIVAKLDRFARSTLDAADALRRIEKAGGQFASAAERFDTTTPFGRFALTVMFALAELELERHRETWATSTGRAIGRGAHIGVPFGYRRGVGKRLEVDEATAPAVRLAYALRAAGESWTGIVDALNASGIKPTRADSWTAPTVKRVLSNRAYLGEAFYGEHRELGAHEALITEAEWQAAQVAKRDRKPRRDDGGPLLGGLVRCAGCSYKMSGGTSGGGKYRARVYACNRRHGGGVCPAPAYITQSLLDEHVEAVFLAHVGDLAFAAVAETEALDGALRELASAETELAAWRDDLRIREAVGHEHYLAGLRARAEAVEAASAKVMAAREASEAARLVGETEIWPTLSVPERRRVLTAGIDAVFVARGREPVAERAVVLWRGEAPDGLPRQGLPGLSRPFHRKPPHAGLPAVQDGGEREADRLAGEVRVDHGAGSAAAV